jgi:hypothetical protein
MGPFKVTALFNSGPSATATWNGTTAMAEAPGEFRLSMPDSFEGVDTYFNFWKLLNLDQSRFLQVLIIEALPGNTVFDLQGTIYDPQVGPSFPTTNLSVTPGRSDLTEGTPDSEKGSTFDWENSGGFAGNGADIDISAVYSNIVNVDPSLAVGDLWTTLTLTFTQKGDFPGLLAGADVNFYADTDMVERATIQATVPEPASCFLFGSFALAAGCHYRRRRSTKIVT